MERLLVTKNGSKYSSTVAGDAADSLTTRDQLDILQEGSIVWFEEGGTRGTAAGAYTPTAGEKYGNLAIGLPTGFNTRVSPRVNMSTLAYTKNAYKAAAGQVSALGSDGVADVTSGDFVAADIGTTFTATVASTAGDFASELIDDATGVAISGQLVEGSTYTVFAAGTPTWGGGTLSSSSTSALVVGTKVIGAEYGYDIVDLGKEVWERRTENISSTLTSASTSDADMLAALVALHNAHPQASLIATAAVAADSAGIVFTSVVTGNAFTIKPKGLFYGTTVSEDGSGGSILPVAGEGTNAGMLELEAKTVGIEGKTSTSQRDDLGEVWKVPSLIESGITYVVYVLTWTDQREVAYVSNNGMPQHKMINLAVPSADSTMITAIDNLLGDLTA